MVLHVILLSLIVASTLAEKKDQCDPQDTIKPSQALIIATDVANIPVEWPEFNVRLRNHDGHFWVSFQGVPSPPDSGRLVKMDLCGNVVNTYGGLGKVLSKADAPTR